MTMLSNVNMLSELLLLPSYLIRNDITRKGNILIMCIFHIHAYIKRKRNCMVIIIYGYTVQYTPRNMHTVFALLCFVVVIHWLVFPYPSGLLHWPCGNLTIAPVPAKQPWWIWINTSCEFIMNDCITTTKQSTTKPCAYFLGYTVEHNGARSSSIRIISRMVHHFKNSIRNQ